jgi:membrane-associated phospholipid phosphatase
MPTIDRANGGVLSADECKASTEEYWLAWISQIVRSEHGLFYCLMAGIAISLSALLAALFRVEHISVVNLHVVRFALQCAVPFATIAAYCHWAKHSQLRDGCWMMLWTCIFWGLLQLPQYVAEGSLFPLQDAALARGDRFLGLNGGEIIAWIHLHPRFEAFSIWSYGLMPWLLFSAIIIPAMAGKLNHTKEFLFATILATLFGSCLVALFPAIGPWVGYHFQPYWNQAWEGTEIHALRSPGPFTANPDYTAGLVAFPSFHVALSVLSVFALWPFRWMRPFAMTVAVLIAISTVTTGWHYAMDGIGGMLVAWLGILVARKIMSTTKI